MEERKKQIKGLEAEDRAVLLPAYAAGGVLGDGGAGELLGDGGEEDAPPHGRRGEQHGAEADERGEEKLISQFHRKHRPDWNFCIQYGRCSGVLYQFSEKDVKK